LTRRRGKTSASKSKKCGGIKEGGRCASSRLPHYTRRARSAPSHLSPEYEAERSLRSYHRAPRKGVRDEEHTFHAHTLPSAQRTSTNMSALWRWWPRERPLRRFPKGRRGRPPGPGNAESVEKPLSTPPASTAAAAHQIGAPTARVETLAPSSALRLLQLRQRSVPIICRGTPLPPTYSPNSRQPRRSRHQAHARRHE